jgi:hypothetical protein
MARNEDRGSTQVQFALTCRSRRCRQAGGMIVRSSAGGIETTGAVSSQRDGSGDRREEYQRADLDALPRWRARRKRVLERGVKRQPSAAVIGAVMNPDQ